MGFRSYQGNTISENGWRICDRNECEVVTVAGMSVPVRRGDAATIIKAWMVWYHNNVERIDLYKPIDDWGWSLDNAVANSNHLSGTAVDLNATQYPWGQPARNNMDAAKIARIRNGLRLFEGTIFWGEDWDYDDPMHYQIGLPEGNPQIATFAAKLRGGYVPGGGSVPLPVVNPATEFEMIRDIRDQICGFDEKRKEYKGWSLIGDNTVVEALAVLGIVVRRIAAKTEVDASELNGFKRP
jgi:hypothetical protein